eukprot:2569377-Prymnesium_polylepis.1
MSKRARSPKSETRPDKRTSRQTMSREAIAEAEDMAEAATRIEGFTLEIEGFATGNTEAATDAETDYM